jgi:two-component sensor histidine kinase
MNVILKNLQMWRIGLIIFGAYTALLLVNLPSVYYFNAQRQQPTDWWILTAGIVWGMYLWVFITPFILWAGNVFRIARPKLWRNVLIHLIVAILIGLVRPAIENFGLWMFGLSSLEAFQTELLKTATYVRSITGAIVTYPSIIGIQHAYFYFRESQERAFRLQQAELQMLKMQLNPHFFFNTLNAISALMYRSPKQADRMIIQLGDMFRIALKKDKMQEVALKEELDFLEAFLQIHQTLMGKRLQIEWQIEPETLDAFVPNLILQPLAENAIQHGLAPLEAGGRITISAARCNGNLLLQVCDDGQGFIHQTGNKNGGIGLSNTRARLENLYGKEQKFSINESSDGGVIVKIEIPFREPDINQI